MIGSGDVPRSKYKVEVLYDIVVLIKPDNDTNADDTYTTFGCMGVTRKRSPNSFAFMVDSVLLSILNL
jgi:hypothetical protein